MGMSGRSKYHRTQLCYEACSGYEHGQNGTPKCTYILQLYGLGVGQGLDRVPDTLTSLRIGSTAMPASRRGSNTSYRLKDHYWPLKRGACKGANTRRQSRVQTRQATVDAGGPTAVVRGEHLMLSKATCLLLSGNQGPTHLWIYTDCIVI
jgi:hypothetical protein